MLEAAGLTQKYFYGATGIKDLSFVLGEGERFAVLGASESGKTTLLKCIAGLTLPESGVITFRGKDITRVKNRERADIQLIHSDGGILRRRSVRFNLEYPLKIRKVSRDVRREACERIAKKFGIYPLLSDFGYLLFEDDIVRTAVARAAMRSAALVMLDDVFGAVKSADRKRLFAEFLPFIRELKGAVIFATTSVEEAFTVGDKVLVLNFGSAEQLASPEELKESPASLFVDKLVNPHKNIAELPVYTDESGKYVILWEMKIILPSDYEEQSVFATYALVEDFEGKKLNAVSYEYNGGRWLVALQDGLKLETGERKSAYTVDVDGESVRVFGTKDEKPLTKS